MPKKAFTPEQIVPRLRQIEVLIGQGKSVPLACKDAGITAQTFYRWRKEYGGLQLEQAKKLKDLQNASIAEGQARRSSCKGPVAR
jgi:putative transposase